MTMTQRSTTAPAIPDNNLLDPALRRIIAADAELLIKWR